jgi:hypothetical protein
MPPHPLNASLNHVISQGVENAQDAISTNSLEYAEIELEHVKLVSSLLEQYLLHGFKEGDFTERLNDYWLSYKSKYIERAFPKYVNDMYVPWKFLDSAIDAHNYWLSKE